MQNRRDFLKRSSLLMAGGLLAPRLLSAGNPLAAYSKTIGIQLYSLRGLVGSDGIQKVLDTVAGIGYKNLETAGYSDGKIYGLEPKDFKKRVADLGMKCTSAHLGQSYSKEKHADVMAWWDRAIDAHQQAGIGYLIQPSMPVNDKSKIEDLQLYCEYFSMVGERASKAGLIFGYHNHTVEFKKIGEHVILDYMLKTCNPQNVCFELDVYWCQEGGANPVDYLKKYPDQIKLTHIKDDKEIGASGKMDFGAIFKQMKKNGITDWYVEIEQYTSGNPVQSAKESFEYLEKSKFVK